MSQFYTRLVVGSALGLLFLVSIFVAQWGTIGAWLFTSIGMVAVVLAQREYYQIAQAKGFQPFVFCGLGISIAYLYALLLSHQFSAWVHLPSLVLILGLLLLFIESFSKPEPLVSLAITAFGVVYLALPLGCMLLIAFFPFQADMQNGSWWLLYLVLVTKITDTAAYFVGKLWGRYPLASRISPKKTIEGALGGFVAAVAASVLFSQLSVWMPNTVLIKLSLWQSLGLGTLFGIVAQLGDLSESILKRDAGVSDSSHLPGLGGFLDIVDSVIFTTPLLFLFLQNQITEAAFA